jgi:hypothetical protein
MTVVIYWNVDDEGRWKESDEGEMSCVTEDRESAREELTPEKEGAPQA